ncbi:MAG: hypothetical protein CW338_08475 [Clostridiales bacterium]|nr:hypothetical protein [Clostridiales bacterium]
MKKLKTEKTNRPAEQKKARKRGGMPRFMRVKYDGRGLLQLGALTLLGLSGYELYIRLDDFSRWTAGIRALSAARQQSFIENMWLAFQAPEMKGLGNILIFLACSVILSLLCLLLCNRPKAGYFLIPAAAGLFCIGTLLPGVMVFGFGALLQWIKLIPLGLIVLGCAINMIEGRIGKRYFEKKEALIASQLPQPQETPGRDPARSRRVIRPQEQDVPVQGARPQIQVIQQPKVIRADPAPVQPEAPAVQPAPAYPVQPAQTYPVQPVQVYNVQPAQVYNVQPAGTAAAVRQPEPVPVPPVAPAYRSAYTYSNMPQQKHLFKN